MRLVDVKAQGCLVYMSGQNKEIKTYKNHGGWDFGGSRGDYYLWLEFKQIKLFLMQTTERRKLMFVEYQVSGNSLDL